MDYEVVEDLALAITTLVRGGDTVPAAEARWVRIHKRYGSPGLAEIRAARELYETAVGQLGAYVRPVSIEDAISVLSEKLDIGDWARVADVSTVPADMAGTVGRITYATLSGLWLNIPGRDVPAGPFRRAELEKAEPTYS
jgi:hypothetical protein